jgi:hypothetical protein
VPWATRAGMVGWRAGSLAQATSGTRLRHAPIQIATWVGGVRTGPRPGPAEPTDKADFRTCATTTFSPTKAVVFSFAEIRSGENMRAFLGQNGPQPWRGKPVTAGFSGDQATASNR